jgi:hypothetical protein
MTEPNAHPGPYQPGGATPGQNPEWPTAPIPTIQPPGYSQQQWPTMHPQPTVPPQAYSPYPQPPYPVGAQPGSYPQAPYGPPMYPPNIVINNVVQTAAVAGTVGRRKSVGVAFVLTFFFGPLGMFYSTVSGAIIMLLASIVLVPLTAGVAGALAWPISIIWGCVAASRANSSGQINQTNFR